LIFLKNCPVKESLKMVSSHGAYKNKFGTNNDASWMKEDEPEENSLLTSNEPFRMIAKLILAEFTLF